MSELAEKNKKKKIIILGGGISGLLAGYAFVKHGFSPLVLDRGKTGGEILFGSLKFFPDVPIIRKLFDELDILYSSFSLRRGMYVGGEVRRYPKCLSNNPNAIRIHADYWAKRYRIPPDDPTVRSVGTIMKMPKKLLRCDLEELIFKLSARLHIELAEVQGLLPNFVHLDSGNKMFDLAIVTIPLWELHGRCFLQIPQVGAVRLCATYVIPRLDCMANWDLIYTPYTPANCIHKISCMQDGYVAEVSGRLLDNELKSDLHYLFPDGFFIRWQHMDLKGELLPMDEKIEWPKNIIPLGRYAQWDSNIMMYHVYKRALEVAHAQT